MSTDLETIQSKIIHYVMNVVEGGDKYTNDPTDRGGATKYGITETLAREYGYTGKMQDLTSKEAYTIYVKTFWLKLKLDDILVIAPQFKFEPIVKELFNSAVNLGVFRVSKFLQICLNIANRNQKDYKDLIVDGNIGQQTIMTLQSFYKRNQTNAIKELYIALNVLQGNKYIDICLNDPTQEKYYHGWMTRVMEDMEWR